MLFNDYYAISLSCFKFNPAGRNIGIHSKHQAYQKLQEENSEPKGVSCKVELKWHQSVAEKWPKSNQKVPNSLKPTLKSLKDSETPGGLSSSPHFKDMMNGFPWNLL
jgi:hypothetical protein